MSYVALAPQNEPDNSVPQLPHELIVSILQYVYADDPSEFLVHRGIGEPEKLPLESKRERLKKLRLEGSAFRDAVTPAIFASIHLHASDLSIARAENIATSNLANYVQEIVYHEGSFADRNPDRELFSSTLASHRRRQDYPWKLLSGAMDDIYYQNFLEEVRAAHRFPFREAHCFQPYPFPALFEKLPNLATFVALPYHDEWHDPEVSAYTLRRTGQSYLPIPRNPTGSYWFLVAMSHLQPRLLNLSIFPFELANTYANGMGFGDKDEELKLRLSRLKQLKLGPAYNARYGYGAGESETWCKSTIRLLRACSNLTHLELTNDYALSRSFATLPKNGLPKLTHLTFSVGSTLGEWPDSGLTTCIRNVGKSLKHLHFSNIILRLWEHGSEITNSEVLNSSESRLASLVNLCYKITAFTSLESCAGLDTIRDSKCEGNGWHMISGPRPGKAAITKKIEEAVCHRRAWPSILMQTVHPHGLIEPSNGVQFDLETRAQAFIHAHWSQTVDEFELCSKLNR